MPAFLKGSQMILSIFVLLPFVFTVESASHGNDRPIIGVLVQEVTTPVLPNVTSDIIASYVKYLETGGARVVPIWIRKPVSYYKDIMSKLNGILFSGGPDILEGDGYGRSGRIIFEIATKMNDEGDFFPLWGTCLGFELMNYAAAKKLWMKSCSAEDYPANIELQKGYRKSRLFHDLSPSLEETMKNKKVAVHYQSWCLTPENYTLSGLDKVFNVLAVQKDSKNLTFISVIEAFKYPFYGVMFHPEKVMFEHEVTDNHHNIPKTLDAMITAQYFANFFVNEARKSNHRFPSKEAEDKVLIYNYKPFFTAKLNLYFEQAYYF